MKHVVVLAVTLLVVASSCGSDTEAPSTSAPADAPPTSAVDALDDTIADVPPATDAAELTVSRTGDVGEPLDEPAPGHVRLWVSNQSFEDDPVSITIAIDGQLVVDDRFAVESQHNWIAYDVGGLPPGTHSFTAESDTGARTDTTFTLPEGEPRWLVADYWYYPDQPEGRHFTLSESDEPVAFA